MSRADEIRAAVQEAGGTTEMTVRELRDAFGLSRLTAAGRTRIEVELRDAGVEIEPPLGRLPLTATVQLVVADPAPPSIVAAPEPVADGPEPEPEPVADEESAPQEEWVAAWAGTSSPAVMVAAAAVAATATTPTAEEADEAEARRRRTRNWRAAVLVGVLVGALVAGLIAVTGFADRESASASVTAPSAATPPAGAAAGATPTPAPQVRGLVQAAERALARDDVPAATEALSRIVEGPATQGPQLAAELSRVRALVAPTEAYIGATALAQSGDYLQAYRQMEELIPFRQSEAAARSYATRAGQTLLKQARAMAATDPDAARKLLAQARAVAPFLSSADDVETRIATARTPAET